ncbi:putative transporter [Cyphellophora attinorum]|uniref:Putative transporter n=1 Tax=Cyphellophora attinorum TaxID=1664694 RepID=A0A0N1P287_9EURO|nr:putative transporter [Phialophora attinorum]KPI45115.1 putative transporter [Phialophora attinorum]
MDKSVADSPPPKDTYAHDEIQLPTTSKKFSFSSKGNKDGDVALALFSDPDEMMEPVSQEEEQKLVRKIDFLILPLIAVNYAFFYIDKTTLSYAAIFGIREDLNLQGMQYSWLSSIFYFGFLAWAFPTNFLMQRLPLAKYLGVNIFFWGFFLIFQGLVNNFAGLAALRALAGAAEACSDPSFMLITCMWYTRKEQPVKIGIWYLANGVGIALGGLLGYAIGHIRGSLASWRYEFIIIGCLCCLWGIVIAILMPDSPVTAKFLSKREKRIAVERLKSNQTGIENKHLKGYQVKEAFLDIKLYLFFCLGVVGNIPNGGISNFGTIIIKGFGFSTLVTTLMQVPYGAFIALSILTCVLLNNRFDNRRCLFILIFLCPNIAGAFGLRFVAQEHHVGRYICYLLTGPYNAAFVLILSLQIANTAGHTKKVVTNAVLFLGYCTGNIAGPFFYLAEQSPTYELGIWSMIVSHLIEVVIVITFWILMKRENVRRDKLQAEMLAGMGPEERERELARTAYGDLTDRENLNFRYIY